MNRSKKLVAMFAALAAIATAGLVAGYASPAQAAYNYCQTERVCLYSNSGGAGYVYVAPYNLKPCNNLPAGFNDITSSVWNRAPYSKITFYAGYNCVGSSRLVAPGAKVDWGVWPRTFNDVVSSYRWGF